jgi:hypothetical protein
MHQIVGESSSPINTDIRSSRGHSEGASASNSISQAALAFKDQGFDLDDDEDSSLGLVDQDHTFEGLMDFTDLDLKDDVSEEFSVQLDNLAFGDNKNDLDEESKSYPSDQAEGVVFQEYLGAETEANDWAKIIEELTEEINTVELKPSNLASQSGDQDDFMNIKIKDDNFHG